MRLLSHIANALAYLSFIGFIAMFFLVCFDAVSPIEAYWVCFTLCLTGVFSIVLYEIRLQKRQDVCS